MSTEKQKTILLVEDELATAMDEKIILERYGYKIITVHTGEEAIKTVEKTPGIDLILMDINLGGGMDGTEAAAIILRQRDIPIVFLSSHTESEVVEKTEKITSYGYVVKASSNTVLDASIKMAFKLFEAGAALRRSEEAYRNLFEHSLDGIIIIVEKLIVRANRAFCSMHGLTAADLLGTSPLELIDPSDRALAAQRIRAFSEDATVSAAQIYRARRHDGTSIWVDVRSKHIKWQGKPGLQTIVRDISEHKQVEASLKQALEWQQTIFEGSRDAIFISDMDSRFVAINNAACDLTGYSREQLLKMRIPDIHDLPDLDAYKLYHQKIFAGEEILSEAKIMRSDSVKIDMEFNNRCVSIAGKLYMHTTARKITERKQADKALIKSEAKYRQLVECLNEGIWMIDEKSVTTFVNSHMVEMLGYKMEEMLGRHLFSFMDEQGVQIAKLKLAQRQQGIKELHDFEFLRKDGTRIYARLETAPITDADGNYRGALAGVVDITEHKQAQDEINRQLAEKIILLKEVHHRIKNNIASIGSLLSLHMQSISNPEAIEVLQDAIGRVNSMRILYDKLLLSEDFKEISAKNYIESLIDSIVAIFPDNAKIKLEKCIDDFQLDTKRLFPIGIIINELITNIMKHAFIDRDSGLIKVSLENVKNHVTLAIQDNGTGLPDKFNINESKGFGLMLVKMLSQQLDGSFSMGNHAGTRCLIEFNI